MNLFNGRLPKNFAVVTATDVDNCPVYLYATAPRNQAITQTHYNNYASIKIKITERKGQYPITDLEIPASVRPAFIQLINRAMNTWDNAPPELKTFADEFIHGEALQDYFSQPR